MQELRANTQVIVRVGPFVDVGDGFTPQIDITLAGNEAELLKAASVEVDISARTWAAIAICRGWYDLTLTTDDTNTEGTLTVVVQDDSDCLPVFRDFMVMSEAAWDSKYAAKDTGYMDVNVKTEDNIDFGATKKASITTACEPSCDNAFATYDPPTKTEMDDAFTEIKGATWSATDTLEGIFNLVISVGADVAESLGYTATLDGDWEDGGRLDLLLDSISDSVSNISNTGSATNEPASSYTLTTGTQSANAYTDTHALDGVKHTHTDTGGTMSLEYHMLLGPGTPSLLTIKGALTGQNDDLDVNVYNWDTPGYQQVGEISGKSSSDNETIQFDLFNSMVGSGADFGKVDIQITGTGLSSATLYIDQLFVSGSQGSGDYNDGAIWVNTALSNENTVPSVDGITTNPIGTWAAAKTLSGKTNIDKFSVVNGSTITMDASCDNLTFVGNEYTIALGTQSFANAHIEEASVSGTGTAGAGVIHFSKCDIGAVTLGKASLDQCRIESTITISAAERYILSRCVAADSGGSPPIIDYNDVAAAVGLRGWNGGIKVKNMAAGSSLSIQGRGKVTIDATCDAGGTIGIHGAMGKQDNVVGGFSGTINDDSRLDMTAINAEVDTALSDWGKSGFSLAADQSAVTIGTVSLVTTCTTNTDMRGTNYAALAATALSTAVWTNTKATYLDASISSVTDNSGSGGVSWTITINDGTNPIDNVGVWITTDEDGDNTVAGTLYTNSAGQVTLMFDAGSYYCWKEKGGYNFTNPQSFTVS